MRSENCSKLVIKKLENYCSSVFNVTWNSLFLRGLGKGKLIRMIASELSPLSFFINEFHVVEKIPS